MVSAPHDMCLLYTRASANPKVGALPRAMTCLQTDDTVSLANNEFLKLEKQHATLFQSSPLETLMENSTMTFNGAALKKENDNPLLSAPKHVAKLKVVEIEKAPREDYVSQRERGAYIASVCRPDLSFRFPYATQFPEPKKKEFKALNKAIEACLEAKVDGLKYVPLHLPSVHMAVFIDASFAGNSDHTSQLGFVICLVDQNNAANLIHYGSSKSKRVTRSVLSVELYAMVYGFDNCSVIHHSLQEFLGRKIDFKMYTDSKSLFDSLVSLNPTTEKRLLIDLTLLRQCYEKREITEVLWIPGSQNPADALTKAKPCNAPDALMATNTVSIDPKGWIERSPAAPNFKTNGSAVHSLRRFQVAPVSIR